MSWTKRIQKALQQTLCRIVLPPYKALCQTKHCKKMHLIWLRNGLIRLSTTVLPCSKGNLRNIYIDEADFSNARRVAKTAAELGNPAMMLYTGLDCHESGKFEEAFTWFTKGAALGQSESIAEVADYYYHFYDAKNLRCTIPYNPVKAIGLYRRAVTKEFSDAGCTALQAVLWLYLSHRLPASRLGTHCQI